MTLSAFEKALKQDPRGDHRHRIEHCGLLNEQTMDKIRDLTEEELLRSLREEIDSAREG